MMSLFCSKNEIIHQTSSSYTSQQNGVAESKHIDILHVARTMMIHMHVLKYLWADAVLSACHLINRTPSSVLHGKIHFSLYPDKSIFSVHPRVFGCTYFVQNLSSDLNKLSPRPIKCVFVRYSRTQKGYQCYNPSTRKYFVSVDVTFFESIPYFSPQDSITASESISLSPFVPLLAPAVVHDVSSKVSLKDTTAPPAPNPPREKDFRYVYTHQQKIPASEPIPTAFSPVEGPPPQPSISSSDFNVPITLCIGKRSYTDHSISHFVSYDHLTPSFRQFALSLSSVSLPRLYEEALLIPAWKQAIDEEVDALISQETWELVSAPKDVVGCRWVYTLKYLPMVHWIGITPDLLPKDILRHMAWTTLRLFHQLLG